ncbi:hypothetical protein, partial [Pseudomonas syringae group genomosp. 7]|uniref:hypothetical protein n=1 Tax=Pseudomonas syringae group genomosp. 7 TaxID=251699 RepID=UPI00376FA0AE
MKKQCALADAVLTRQEEIKKSKHTEFRELHLGPFAVLLWLLWPVLFSQARLLPRITNGST